MPGQKKLWPAYETLHPNNPKFERLSKIAEVIFKIQSKTI